MSPVHSTERQNILLETVSPDSDVFQDDDEAFYEYEDDLAGLVRDFGWRKQNPAPRGAVF